MNASEQNVWDSVVSTVEDVICDYKGEPETDRDDVIERLDEECDCLFGSLVKHGRIDQYDVDDLVETAADCAAIIKVAEAKAWVETDNGLWEGVTYGVLASIAYFSLRNLLYAALKAEGYDCNDDFPFKNKDEEEEEDADDDNEPGDRPAD